MRLMHFRPSPATVVATLALVVAGAGVGTAASGLVSGSQIKPGTITGKQIKNHSITLNKLTGKLPAGATGHVGAQGPQGVQGVAGPGGSSLGLVESVDAPGTTGTSGSEITLATLHSIPAGSYILTGKIWLSGGITATQVHCYLRAGTDVDETDVFMSGASAAAAASFILPHTFASTGTATLSCNSFGNSFGTNHAKIAALQVQSLTINPA